MIEVRVAGDNDGLIWESYLKNKSCHHAFSWHWRSILPDAFGHTPYYLLALRKQESGTLPISESVEDHVIGLLPLAHVKSFLFGQALVSLPYLNGGGIVADDQEAFQALLHRAQELSRELGTRYVELRHREELAWAGTDLSSRSHKVAMVLKLNANHEDLFATFPAKLRSQVRRPIKNGVVAKVSGLSLAEDESLDAFYKVFAENMRDLGTPVYPKRLFEKVSKRFGAGCRIITIWLGNQVVASAITLGLGTHVEIPWASSLKQHNKLSANMLLYWQAIQTACADGFLDFDFGRSSPDSGTFRFKKQWGAEPLPLHWYYLLERGEIPDVNPNSAKYSALVACWKRLPLPLANSLGPFLTKSLP